MSTDFGSTLADYRVGRQIGVGGFSTVYEAAPVRAPSRRVALKIIAKQDLAALDLLDRLVQEIGIHTSVAHAHICPLLHCFEDAVDGRVVLVLPFFELGDARSYLAAMQRDHQSRQLPLSSPLPAPLLPPSPPPALHSNEDSALPSSSALALSGLSINAEEAASSSPSPVGLDERVARRLVADIVDALRYLHAHHIVHRDLKLANVLLSFNHSAAVDALSPSSSLPVLRAHLCDFGLAVRLRRSDEADNAASDGSADLPLPQALSHVSSLPPAYQLPAALTPSPARRRGVDFDASYLQQHTMCGTPNFIAPESAARDADGHGAAADLWALGCIVYALCVGRPPFDSDSVRHTLARVTRAEFDFPAHLSPAARDLISALLQRDPCRRMPLEQVAAHPFLTGLPFHLLAHLRQPLRLSFDRSAAARTSIDSLGSPSPVSPSISVSSLSSLSSPVSSDHRHRSHANNPPKDESAAPMQLPQQLVVALSQSPPPLPSALNERYAHSLSAEQYGDSTPSVSAASSSTGHSTRSLAIDDCTVSGDRQQHLHQLYQRPSPSAMMTAWTARNDNSLHAREASVSASVTSFASHAESPFRSMTVSESLSSASSANTTMCSTLPLLNIPVAATVSLIPAGIATNGTAPTSVDLAIPRIVFQPLDDSDEEAFDEKRIVEPSIVKLSVSSAHAAVSITENEASLATSSRPNVDAHASHLSVASEDTATSPWQQPLLVSTDASDTAAHAATALTHTQSFSTAIIPPVSEGLSQPSTTNVSDRALRTESATLALPTSPVKPAVKGESPLPVLASNNEASSPIALPMLSTSRLQPMCIPLSNGSKLTVLLNGDAVYHSYRHCSSLHVHINRRPQGATLICSNSSSDSGIRATSARPPLASPNLPIDQCAYRHLQPVTSTVRHHADLGARFASLPFAVRAQLLVMHQLLERCRARCGKIVCEFGLTADSARAQVDGGVAALPSCVSGACALMENDEGGSASCRGDTRLELYIPIGSSGGDECFLHLLWLHRPAVTEQRLYLIAAAFVSALGNTAGESGPLSPPPILSAQEQCWTAEQLSALPSFWWSPDSGEQQQLQHSSDSESKLDTSAVAWNAFFASLGGSPSQFSFFFHQMRRVVCRTSAVVFPHVARLQSRDYIALQWHARDREMVERALADVLRRTLNTFHPISSAPVV